MSTYKTMPATDAKTPRGRRIVLAAAAVSFCLGAYVAQAASKTPPSCLLIFFSTSLQLISTLKLRNLTFIRL